ncbi:hypothetical protein EON63_01735 [archaeon]|nr:MAG: hypothetical protein EON63_01735 [archaeon]
MIPHFRESVIADLKGPGCVRQIWIVTGLGEPLMHYTRHASYYMHQDIPYTIHHIPYTIRQAAAPSAPTSAPTVRIR